jgi:hypothetical protein
VDVNADIPISNSAAQATAQNPFQDASTVFEFSSPGNTVSGPTYAPSNDLTPTATSSAQSPGGILGSLDSTTLFIIGGIVLAGLWITHRH